MVEIKNENAHPRSCGWALTPHRIQRLESRPVMDPRAGGGQAPFIVFLLNFFRGYECFQSAPQKLGADFIIRIIFNIIRSLFPRSLFFLVFHFFHLLSSLKKRFAITMGDDITSYRDCQYPSSLEYLPK